MASLVPGPMDGGAAADEAEDTLTRAVGRSPTFSHAAFSPEGIARGAAFRPRSSDVFILTPPKTGTTWMQMLCHALRTQGQPGDFDDIYQVVPWDQLAWDLGQDMDSEQVALPRLFKTHQRLSAINRGARYICLVRCVEDVLRSWWNFLRPKDIPPLRKYSSASEFAFDTGFFADGMRFGATIWEYYVEFFQALQLPNVMVFCYEDIVATKWIKLQTATYVDQRGTSRAYDMVSRTSRPQCSGVDGVVMVPLLRTSAAPRDVETLIVLQFRLPVGKVTAELPAGMVDAGETPSQAAVREMKEKTGYTATVCHCSGIISNCPFLVNDIENGVVLDVDLDAPENQIPSQELDAEEFIEVRRVKLFDVFKVVVDLEARGVIVAEGLHLLAFGLSLGRTFGALPNPHE